MSGFNSQFNYQNQESNMDQRSEASPETVWSLNDQIIMNGEEQNHNPNPRRDFGRSREELPPSGLLQNGRTDSINSTTVFVNPNDIQPRFGGAERQVNQGGVKRRLSEVEEGQEAKVIVVGADGRVQTEEIIFTPDETDCTMIPLGGSAETEDNNSNQSWSQADNSWSNKVEENSNQSWVTTTSSSIIPNHHPLPTGVNPSTVNYPGHYMFDVKFSQLSQHTKNKHWDYSSRLNKLFVDMNKWVQVEFRVGPNPPQGLYVRALPVYAEASHVREPVKRCPNHASPSDPTNIDCHHPMHLIRLDGDGDVMYCEDTESGRLSVAFPVRAPHQGSDFCHKLIKFMCLGSDVGGINRRPVKVIFTLEMQGPMVVGRKVVNVRICSCPKRDKQQEEARLDHQEEQARRIGQRFADTTAVIAPPTNMGPPPPGKKMKIDKEPIIMVPVHAEDFKKINEFSEAAWIVRDPANKERIIETRRRLLQEHNSQLIKKLDKKKPSQ